MRFSIRTTALFGAIALSLGLVANEAQAETAKLRVVATQSTWASIASYIGGKRVTVDALAKGNQDPHFVRPRPSLAQKLTKAGLFISTGLDLELWVPSLVDLSRNSEIRSGQKRYVAAAQGVKMLAIPQAKTREAGGVHIYGNPHIQTNPLNIRVVAKNIATGLSNVDPAGKAQYTKNYERFCAQIDERLYGKELVRLVGGPTLNRLAENPNRLIGFLEKRQYQGAPMKSRLGGWLKQGLGFRGKKAVAYHKNWTYFSHLFGLQIRGYVEPRPAIPPTPRHIQTLVKQMQQEKIGVILSASYYDQPRVRSIAKKVGATAVIVPLAVGGDKAATDYFSLMDTIVARVAKAYP